MWRIPQPLLPNDRAREIVVHWSRARLSVDLPRLGRPRARGSCPPRRTIRLVHLCYIDEAGSSGKNLADRQQPMFAMAGLLVSDEKWKKTERESQTIVEKALGSSPPAGFEIHAGHLLAPNGAGPFERWPQRDRTQLALDLLRLLDERSHQVLLQLVHKPRMAAAIAPALPLAIDWKDPWELGFAALVTMTEEFLRSGRTGRSSTGMVIIDHDAQYLQVIRAHARDRQLSKGWMETRKVMEIGYSAVSHENPMIQLADLVAFTMKRWAMSQAGYGKRWPTAAHDFVNQCHDLIWQRVEFKALSFPSLKVPAAFTDYLKEVRKLK